MPGVVPPRESNPLSFAVGNAVVQTPLPDFNWADRDGRWTYINDQLLPVYNNLMKNQRNCGERRWPRPSPFG